MAEIWTIGLMSGTSLDGIDVALLATDGERLEAKGPAATWAYEEAFRERLRALLGGQGEREEIAAVEAELTDRHAAVVEAHLVAHGVPRERVALVGFHGQTILHAPERHLTWQIGDGQRLADRLGLPVVADFRSADVAAGGQGAPFVPAYHRALAADLERPLALLNIGGVANVTWIGASEDDLVACDTGPGNALLDDWVAERGGGAFDRDGLLSAAGLVQRELLERLLAHPFFHQPPPKSLDRDAFEPELLNGLTLEDGAATLAAFTVEAVARLVPLLPAPPCRWLVSGGGRRNPTLLHGLAEALGSQVEPVEAVGLDGDVLEAQAFAFLAQRSRRGLPLSYPGTTGVPQPQIGGRLFQPA